MLSYLFKWLTDGLHDSVAIGFCKYSVVIKEEPNTSRGWDMTDSSKSLLKNSQAVKKGSPKQND